LVKDAKAVMEEVKRMKKESKLKKKFLKLENKRKNLGSETASWHVVVLWCILKFVLFSAKIASHICLRKKLQKKLKKQAKGKGEKDDESSSSSSSTSSLSEATQARLRKDNWDNWASKRSWCSKTCLANQQLGFYRLLIKNGQTRSATSKQVCVVRFTAEALWPGRHASRRALLRAAECEEFGFPEPAKKAKQVQENGKGPGITLKERTRWDQPTHEFTTP